MTPRRLPIVPVLLLAGLSVLSIAFGRRPSAAPLPVRLSDQEFWKLSADLSEPNGYFRSENLVSNEHTFQYVIPALEKMVPSASVYLGVAPDQNFTYLVALKPRMAFIVDIRRGNLLEHLLYKAILEMSADRAEFVSRLFSKKRPNGLSATSTVVELFTAFDQVRTSEDLYKENVKSVTDRLVKAHGFALSPDDLEQLESIYFAFFWEGPSLKYSSAPSGFGGRNRGFGGSNFPSYEDLMLQTDWQGQSRSYLATEENFRFLKQMEERNLVVPVVGNFAGPKALRAVGRYVRDHGATVSAFYVSNVEQYLFQDGIFDDFARNVATLPVDATSTFIRSVSSRFGFSGGHQWADGRATGLDPIREFVRDFQAGRVKSYYDVNARSK
jgi:hypothetical protein